MKRLEFLNKARALAQQQCENSSCMSDKEYAGIVAEDTPEISLYEKALEILTDAASDMDSEFMEICRDVAESED